MVDVHNVEKGSYMNGKYDTIAVAGKDLVTSLDAGLQEYGERLMQNKKGSIVAIEPATGEILCLVTSPSYDPNLLVGSVRAQNFATLAKDTIRIPLFNRALMASYPPGSIFKLLDALIGQQEGVLFPETLYPCAGGYPPMGGKPRCHAHASPSNLTGAIRTSCNSYFSYVFRSIIDSRKFSSTRDGYQHWRDHLLSFGVGKKLGSDLPYELKGNVPTVDYYKKLFFGEGRWKSSTIVSLAIGQGELGILPVQMANVMCIIANRGYCYTPHVVRSVAGDDNFRSRFKEKQHSTVDPKYFEVVVDAMHLVVESGTAAQSKIKDLPFCGKTGTAQNPHGKDHSVFVGFAPKDNPRIAIACVVENAGFGAQWAAPISSLMIEKYLRDTISRTDLEQRMLEGNLIDTQ
jgi:penicillin-binding protein 2